LHGKENYNASFFFSLIAQKKELECKLASQKKKKKKCNAM
jgi:hypothetical protein